MRRTDVVVGLGVLISLIGNGWSMGSPLCSSKLQYKGVCVLRNQACPFGTVEYPYYSNYLGCVTMDKKCCAPPGLLTSTKTTTTTKAPDAPPTFPPTCGLGSQENFDRILDGQPTGVCDWPFVVSIRALLQNSRQLSYDTTSHSCQGVLIGRQWVLTSPFCILGAASTVQEAPGRLLVVAGEYNVSGIDRDPLTGQQQEQLIGVSSVYFYPTYAYKTQLEALPFDDTVKLNSNGVALIKLSEPINGRCSGIICLPSYGEAANNCAGYEECVITGWGFSTETFDDNLSPQLLSGRVKLSSRETCNFLTERLGLQSSRPNGTTCQSPTSTNTDSCLGDEGGAVMCYNGYNWVVRGILPFNLCANGRYNLFVTDVAPYLGWIQDTVNANGGGLGIPPNIS